MQGGVVGFSGGRREFGLGRFLTPAPSTPSAAQRTRVPGASGLRPCPRGGSRRLRGLGAAGGRVAFAGGWRGGGGERPITRLGVLPSGPELLTRLPGCPSSSLPGSPVCRPAFLSPGSSPPRAARRPLSTFSKCRLGDLERPSSPRLTEHTSVPSGQVTVRPPWGTSWYRPFALEPPCCPEDPTDPLLGKGLGTAWAIDRLVRPGDALAGSRSLLFTPRADYLRVFLGRAWEDCGL